MKVWDKTSFVVVSSGNRSGKGRVEGRRSISGGSDSGASDDGDYRSCL